MCDELAAVLHGKGDIRLEQRRPSDPGESEVLVRLDSVGICGSDVHQWRHGGIGDKSIESPMVMGHEGAGVVERCGEGVAHLVPGDRVAIEPGVPCGRCRHCTGGRYNVCPDMRFCAAPPVDGLLRRGFVHPAAFCHKLPDAVTLEEGALIEPLSVAVHACHRGGVTLGSRVLVCGAGPVGVMCLLTAKALGAAGVVVTDIDEGKLEFAKSMGADQTILVERGESACDAGKAIFEGEGGADVSIECSGAESSARLALFAACPGGVVVLVGLGPAEIMIPVIRTCMRREVDVRGVFRYANCYPRAVSMVAAGKVDLKPLVSHRFALENVQRAFETANCPESGAMKIVIKCSGSKIQ